MVGRGCFSDGGSSFVSWRVPHGGASVLMGEKFFEKNCWMGGRQPPCTPTMENPGEVICSKKNRIVREIGFFNFF